jgi:hypothetical protein
LKYVQPLIYVPLEIPAPIPEDYPPEVMRHPPPVVTVKRRFTYDIPPAPWSFRSAESELLAKLEQKETEAREEKARLRSRINGYYE